MVDILQAAICSLPMSNTPFSKAELDSYKQKLQEKKARILAELQGQSEEISQQQEETGDLADLATELLERELNLSLSESEKQVLMNIDRALDRIKNGSYGICIDTGAAISRARLDAIPEAARTVEAQSKYDKESHAKRARNSSYPSFGA